MRALEWRRQQLYEQYPLNETAVQYLGEVQYKINSSVYSKCYWVVSQASVTPSFTRHLVPSFTRHLLRGPYKTCARSEIHARADIIGAGSLQL